MSSDATVTTVGAGELNYELDGWTLRPALVTDIPELFVQASVAGWRWRRAWRSAAGWVPSALRFELENSYEIVGVLRSPLADLVGVLGVADVDVGSQTAEIEAVAFNPDAILILGQLLKLVVADIRSYFPVRVLYFEDWSDERPIPEDGWVVEVEIPGIASLDGVVVGRRTWALHLQDPDGQTG